MANKMANDMANGIDIVPNTGIDGGGETGLSYMHELLTQMPEYFSTTHWCLHICSPVLAKHIDRAGTRLHAVP
jgi:hypothetical protein